MQQRKGQIRSEICEGKKARGGALSRGHARAAAGPSPIISTRHTKI